MKTYSIYECDRPWITSKYALYVHDGKITLYTFFNERGEEYGPLTVATRNLVGIGETRILYADLPATIQNAISIFLRLQEPSIRILSDEAT